MLGEEILADERVVNQHGESLPLSGETAREQCYFLQELVHAVKPAVSLEIGLAYGVSTLFICEALRETGAERHIVIDKSQAHAWGDVGLCNIERAGYADLVDFQAGTSQDVLPALLKDGVRIDFAYVDTTKLFDAVLVDVYFLTRLLNVGGLLVLDDCTLPSLNKLARFTAKHPSFVPFRRHKEYRLHPVLHAVHHVASLIPKADKVFASRVIETDEQLGVNAHCVAFRKVCDDDRPYMWHASF